MNLYATREFKEEVQKLKKKKPYRTIWEDLEKFISKRKTLDDFKRGTRLNATSNSPNYFIKERINGSGGHRIYILVLNLKDCVVFMYIHPKTGPEEQKVLKKDAHAEMLANCTKAILDKDLLKLLKPDEKSKTLKFTEIKQPESEPIYQMVNSQKARFNQ